MGMNGKRESTVVLRAKAASTRPAESVLQNPTQLTYIPLNLRYILRDLNNHQSEKVKCMRVGSKFLRGFI